MLEKKLEENREVELWNNSKRCISILFIGAGESKLNMVFNSLLGI